MTKLATIGYEGADLATFIATLMQAGINHLIDVREMPLSRKKGFSKRALSEALSNAGIEYSHLRALGDPKPGREAARRGDIPAFRKIFGAHMASRDAKAALEQATELAADGYSCLMCFEREPHDCHRSIVAMAMANRGSFKITHLAVP